MSTQSQPTAPQHGDDNHRPPPSITATHPLQDPVNLLSSVLLGKVKKTRCGKIVFRFPCLSRSYTLPSITFLHPFPCPPVNLIPCPHLLQSTLLNMIAGLDSPDMGELVVGETVDVMYVDQNREGLDDPELSVFEAVTEGAEEINLGPRTINR